MSSSFSLFLNLFSSSLSSYDGGKIYPELRKSFSSIAHLYGLCDDDEREDCEINDNDKDNIIKNNHKDDDVKNNHKDNVIKNNHKDDNIKNNDRNNATNIDHRSIQSTYSIPAYDAPRYDLNDNNAAPRHSNNDSLAAVIASAYKSVDQINTVEDLYQYAKNFKLCDLQKSAKNTVFARGNINSRIMCIGEAPGAQEDLDGVPFCGQSGKLLDNIFLAMDIDPYITNTVFWRPPMNRRPTTQELSICLPIVEKHIALCAPKFILLIGSVAMENLLPHVQANLSITKARQQIFLYKNRYMSKDVPMSVVFHPAYLLRQQNKKSEMLSDMRWVIGRLNDSEQL